MEPSVPAVNDGLPAVRARVPVPLVRPDFLVVSATLSAGVHPLVARFLRVCGGSVPVTSWHSVRLTPGRRCGELSGC